ncbi:MAG TPA: ABC transporter ATP-binding protein [Nitrososphaerales archaeon]
MYDYAVECKDVSKQYGPLRALRGVTINIEIGDIVAVSGHNGAGKSTFLKIVGTHISSSSGNVKVLGNDTTKDRAKVRRDIGFLGHTSFMYDELTVEENLRFYGVMFSINRPTLDKRIKEVIEYVNLERYRHTAAKKLSHGLRKRADIARVFTHSPKVLILDEPFSGLDEKSIKLLIDGFRSQIGKITMLISSHSFEMMNSVFNRTLMFSEGKILKNDRVT